MTVTILVRCVHGLEWICAEELVTLVPGARRMQFDRREIAFTLPQVELSLLELRTADDVFLEVGRGEATGGGQIAASVLRMPWLERLAEVARVRRVPDDPAIDVVASVEGRRSISRYTVEHALGPPLAAMVGGRYLRRTDAGREPGQPDLVVRVFVRRDGVHAAVRLAAQPLHRRGYKLDTGPGTLHPPVAAALVRLAGLDTGAAILDPFCGDGTIPVEAALAHPGARIQGSDVDPGRLDHARRNAERAGVSVVLDVADAGRLPPPEVRYDAVVTNPPWNRSVDASGDLRASLDPFWQRLPDLLMRDGRLVAIIAADTGLLATLARLGHDVRLRTQVRLAGRLSDIIVAAPPGRSAPDLPGAIATWREAVIATGVVTDSGF